MAWFGKKDSHSAKPEEVCEERSEGDLAAITVRPVTTTPWGPCTELIGSVVPEEVRDDLRRRAAEFRQTESEMVRFMILVALYGRDEVKKKYSAELDSKAGIVKDKGGFEEDKILKYAVGNMAAIKTLQTGSDILIDRHTEIKAFKINSAIRKRANDIIKHLYLHGFMEDMCEEEAAIIKLAAFYKAAEKSNEQHMILRTGAAITKFRDFAEGKIRADISLKVMGDTGH